MLVLVLIHQDIHHFRLFYVHDEEQLIYQHQIQVIHNWQEYNPMYFCPNLLQKLFFCFLSFWGKFQKRSVKNVQNTLPITAIHQIYKRKTVTSPYCDTKFTKTKKDVEFRKPPLYDRVAGLF